MEKASSPSAAVWLYGGLLMGGLLGAAIFYFASPKEPCDPCPPLPEVKWLSVFGQKNVAAWEVDAAVGVRFYLAKSDDGEPRVLASPITEDGRHELGVAGTGIYHVYKAVVGAGTEVMELTEEEAKRAVLNASTSDRPVWSVDVPMSTLKELLSVERANGIGLVERRTASDTWTFELAPVTIASDAAVVTGSAQDIRICETPCPMLCPRDARVYLHMRD